MLTSPQKRSSTNSPKPNDRPAGRVALAGRAARRERVAVDGRVELGERPPRLPGREPGVVALADLAPRREVLGHERPQHHPAAVQAQRRRDRRAAGRVPHHVAPPACRTARSTRSDRRRHERRHAELQAAHDREHGAARGDDRGRRGRRAAPDCAGGRRAARWPACGTGPRGRRDRSRPARRGRRVPCSTSARCHASSPPTVNRLASMSAGCSRSEVVEEVGHLPRAFVRLIAAGRVVLGELAGRQRPWGRVEGRRPVPDARATRSSHDRQSSRRGCRRRRSDAAELGGDPPSDRVVAAGEVPGVVGVEALHALAGAADAARRAELARRRGTSASRSAA